MLTTEPPIILSPAVVVEPAWKRSASRDIPYGPCANCGAQLYGTKTSVRCDADCGYDAAAHIVNMIRTQLADVNFDDECAAKYVRTQVTIAP